MKHIFSLAFCLKPSDYSIEEPQLAWHLGEKVFGRGGKKRTDLMLSFGEKSHTYSVLSSGRKEAFMKAVFSPQSKRSDSLSISTQEGEETRDPSSINKEHLPLMLERLMRIGVMLRDAETVDEMRNGKVFTLSGKEDDFCMHVHFCACREKPQADLRITRITVYDFIVNCKVCFNDEAEQEMTLDDMVRAIEERTASVFERPGYGSWKDKGLQLHLPIPGIDRFAYYLQTMNVAVQTAFSSVTVSNPEKKRSPKFQRALDNRMRDEATVRCYWDAIVFEIRLNVNGDKCRAYFVASADSSEELLRPLAEKLAGRVNFYAPPEDFESQKLDLCGSEDITAEYLLKALLPEGSLIEDIYVVPESLSAPSFANNTSRTYAGALGASLRRRAFAAEPVSLD